MLVAPLAAVGPAGSANANPGNTGLVISEVYGGGGNTGATFTNDFIELYNPTGSAISVAAMSVQYRSATGSGTGFTNLSGSVPAGRHYLIQEAAGTGGTNALPTPDVVGSINMSGTAGSVALVTAQGTTTPDATNTVDLVGFGAAAVLNEGSPALGASNTASVSRNAVGTDTDNNATDFTAGAPTPQNGPLQSTSPGTKTSQVDSPIVSFTLPVTGGTAPYSWAATGLPAGVTVATNGVVSGTPTATGTYPVTATVTDSAGTPASAVVNFTFEITAPVSLRPIAEIQGTGATTPLAGQNVQTQGVVTASYPTGGLNGFYLQTPGPDTAGASDAIFVYGGTGGFTDYPAVGDSIEVTGQAGEAFGATQIAANQAGVVEIAALGTVTPKTQVPGTACALPGTNCLAGAALDEAREVAEGELFQPTAPWTATDVYDGSPYYQGVNNSGAFRGEIGVAADSDKPLVAPTEVIDAQATAAIAERVKYNDAHRIILDDASSLTFSTTQNNDKPFPWFTPSHTVRVGAAITFTKPVIFTAGFGAWRILPQSQIVGDPTGTIDFEQTRPAAPENVGGDVKLATFNVLNFFPTTGEEFVAAGGGNTCTFYTDRANNRITNNRCNPDGPRGAANEENLTRQRDKIVSAINTVDADIVSLEELENSVKFGKPRDFAIDALVTALNADAGAGTWAAVPSAAILPPTAEQDVIRNGFVYQPANVALVGDSIVLSDQSASGQAFEDAREPLAQAFKEVGTTDADAFAVIVNHFKSKGSGTPDPDGQGNATDRRVLQADGLVTFADSFKTQRNISRVYLAGDFNAYSMEDPIQVLNAAGYTNLESTSRPDEETYNFDGMIGSLDHVLANAPALADVNAVDVWDINGYESLYYEYSRFNSNVTNLYAPNPFRSSDHSPEIVGINTANSTPGPVVTAAVSPASIRAQVDTATILVEVTSTIGTPTGMVTAQVDGVIVGGAELVDGKASVRVGPFATPGTKVITVKYSGDADNDAAQTETSVTVTPAPATERASATVTTTVSPATVAVFDGRATVSVTVAKAAGTPTGAVLALVDGEVVGAAELVAGKADISLMPFSTVGSRAVEVQYSGDATTKPAAAVASVQVVKAQPRLRVNAPNRTVKAKPVKIKVTVKAPGYAPTGKVVVKVKGTKVVKRINNGKVTVTLRLTKLGKNKVKIRYRGDDLTESTGRTITIKVQRR